MWLLRTAWELSTTLFNTAHGKSLFSDILYIMQLILWSESNTLCRNLQPVLCISKRSLTRNVYLTFFSFSLKDDNLPNFRISSEVPVLFGTRFQEVLEHTNIIKHCMAFLWGWGTQKQLTVGNTTLRENWRKGSCPELNKQSWHLWIMQRIKEMWEQRSFRMDFAHVLFYILQFIKIIQMKKNVKTLCKRRIVFL